MSLQTKEVCVCDECGVERDKDTNHWWMASRSGGGDGFSVYRWDDQFAQETKHWATIQHLCGLTCLYKAIDKLAQKILREEAATK